MSISISNCISDVAVIIFPVGKITVSGVVVKAIAGSFATNLQLMNDCVVPVSSIAGTENPWVWMDRYNRAHCNCKLLN